MPTPSAHDALPESDRALLLVDFINPLDFPGAENLARGAVAAAEAAHELKKCLTDEGVPSIYANDNYGRWQSDFKDLVSYCQGKNGAAAKIARLMQPGPHDLTIFKPRYSAFFSSPLELLLQAIGVKELIIVGLATDMCVQLTAVDAFLRDYTLKAPSDCTAAESDDYKKQALLYMERVLKCDTAPMSFIKGAA